MGKVGSVGCVGFLMEGTVFWWLSMDIVFLVCKITSIGVLCSACELIMILDSSSANGWVCVPVFLIVLHRVSSTVACWSLRDGGFSVEMEISGRTVAV